MGGKIFQVDCKTCSNRPRVILPHKKPLRAGINHNLNFFFRRVEGGGGREGGGRRECVCVYIYVCISVNFDLSFNFSGSRLLI